MIMSETSLFNTYFMKKTVLREFRTGYCGYSAPTLKQIGIHAEHGFAGSFGNAGLPGEDPDSNDYGDL